MTNGMTQILLTTVHMFDCYLPAGRVGYVFVGWVWVGWRHEKHGQGHDSLKITPSKTRMKQCLEIYAYHVRLVKQIILLSLIIYQ